MEHLRGRGDDFVRLVRRPTRGEPNLRSWDPSNKEIDVAVFEGADAVIHLSGEPIVEGRWSAGKKRRIRSSREGTTAFLAKTLARLGTKPPVMVASSAVGFYGNRGNEVLTETSTPGTGFLAEVCQAWELAADPAREARAATGRSDPGPRAMSSGATSPRPHARRRAAPSRAPCLYV